jgi:uncharacterized protein YndB with AHSA1/START domain
MKTLNISDEAVLAKTGKTWDEWFSLLDQAGAQKMNHKEIVAVLNENYTIDDWWQQSVTVSYENSRGLREKHEMADGFQISKNITIAASVERAFAAWTDEMERIKWLNETQLSIRKATPNKSLRITWADGKTSLEVYFYVKRDRVKISLNHSKIPDQKQAEYFKSYWADQFARLKTHLEA